jgi:hypothetical protein
MKASPQGGGSSALVVAIVAGGIVAGTIDIGSACLINHRNPAFILQTIAGGLLAEKTYSGGTSTVLLGALLQEAMAVLIAAIYGMTSRWLPVLTRRWVTLSLVYGVIVFLVMNYVVLPLCAWKYRPQFSGAALAGNLLAMLLFGLIIGYFVKRTRGSPGSLSPN